MNKKGFSIIEILMVVFIMTVLMVLGFINYRAFEKKMELNTTVNKIILSLQLAAGKTISSEGSTVYGVHFEADSYTLFRGASYSALDSNNVVSNLSSTIEIYNIGVGGSDVIFDRITGGTANSGDIGLRIGSYPLVTKTIKVLSSGRVGLTGAVTPTGARATDFRHTHFDLGWTIQGQTNLVLNFTDTPNVQETIDMADYFTGGQTEFDWEGSVNVNGSPQILRIHTHSIDAFNTMLCIHRDGRYNNKQLQVSIDGKDIVSYTAAGTATIGFFGGAMTAQ